MPTDKQHKLNMAERNRLVLLEDRIQQGEKALLEMMAALKEICTKKLYRNGKGRDFEGYCLERWGKTSRRINQLRTAADVIARLMKSEPMVPMNERQARALTSLPPAAQGPAMNAAVRLAGGVQPTAAEIAEAAEQFADITEDMTAGMSPAKIEEFYAERGQNVTKLVEKKAAQIGGDQDERLKASIYAAMKQARKNAKKLGGDNAEYGEFVAGHAQAVITRHEADHALDLAAAA